MPGYPPSPARHEHEEHEDTVRVSCRYALTIPAQSEAVVWARLPARPYGPNNWVVVEPHGECQEVEVARALATVHRGRVPVRVRNTKPYPVNLHRRQGLARVMAVGPQQLKENSDVCFNQLSPGVVEMGIMQVGQGENKMSEAMPEHLCCESLQGNG